MRKLHFLVSASALLAIPEAALAAVETASHDDYILVQAEANQSASTVATRVAVEALQTPYSVTTVSDRVITDTGAQSLADVMRYAAIVGGTDNFGNAGEFFSSRGFQLGAGSNYFRDGLRYRKYGQVPLYDMERIEILRGPASILYGALEPGGVVNIVSRTPQDEFGAKLRLRAGSHDLYQGVMDVTGPLAEGMNVRVQGLYEDAGSFRDQMSSHSAGLSGIMDMQLSPDTLLTARASWFKDRRTGDRGTVLAYREDGPFEASNGRRYGFADIPRSRFLGEDFANNRFRDINLSLSLRHQLNDDWQMRGDIIRSDQKEERVYIWAISADQIVESNGLLQRQIGDWNARLKGTLGRLEVAGKLDIGGTTHKLLIGGEYEHFRNTRTNERYQFAPINIYDPAYLSVRPANGTRTTNSPYGSLFKSHGFYIQNIVEIGEQFVLLGGLRYDRVTDDNLLNNQRRQVASGWTPQGGLVWRPAPWISPYISYTRSFTPQSGTDRDGNPFDPEKGQQYEVGIKLDAQKLRSFATLAVFSLDRENLTMTDPDNPQYQVLTGLQRSQGFDLSVHSTPVDGLRLSVNYNHLFSAKYVNDNRLSGNIIPNAPKSALGLFASYDFAQASGLSGLSLSGGVTHSGLRQGKSDNAFYLPAYTLVDAGVKYRLTDKVALTANVRNLLDETYYTGSINSTTVGVGQPRSVLFGLNFGL